MTYIIRRTSYFLPPTSYLILPTSYLTLLLLLLFSYVSFSQESEHRIAGLANPKEKENAIQLRWSPSSNIAWEIGNKYGYTIERFTITSNGELLPQPRSVLLTPQPVKPYTLQQMEVAAKKDDRVAAIAELLYGDDAVKKVKPEDGIGAFIENKNQQEWRMAIALISCDMSKAAAKSAGLYFEDHDVKKGERYTYRISVAQQPKNLIIDTAYIYTSLEEPMKLAPPQELAIVCADSVATLGWLTTFTKGSYSAYNVERSTNGKDFKPVTDVPILPTNADGNGFSYYQDSLPDNDRVYYYRVSGVTPFGEYGPYSKIVQGTGVANVEDRPVMDTIIIIENKKVQLRWLLPGKLSEQLTKIVITRSPDGNKAFLPIAELKSSQTTYTDNSPLQSNYYRIKGITKNGKAINSFPYLALLIDSIPPDVPTGLAGKIDSLGVVTLNWNANKEKDLQGYRVFRANSLKEEFIEVTRDIIRNNTQFTDTVTLHTLSSKVYYKIIAADMNYNTSGYSQYLMLKRPDTIAPVSPIFTKNYRSDSLKALVLQWRNSSSEDVVKYTLDRICRKDKSKRQIALWDTTNKRETYTDTTALQQSNTYYYELTAYDDAGNKTTETSGDVWFETKRTAITQWKAEVNKEKRQVVLTWSYNDPEIKQYRIYRSKNDFPYISFKTEQGNTNQVIDTEVAQGNVYHYKIMGVLKGDAKTEMSKEVEAKF